MSCSRRLATSATCSSRAARTKDCSRIRSVLAPRPVTRSARRGHLLGPVAQLGQLHLGGGDVAGQHLERRASQRRARASSATASSRPPVAAGAPRLERGDVGARARGRSSSGSASTLAQRGDPPVVLVELRGRGRRARPAVEQRRGRGEHVVEPGLGGPLPRRPRARCRPRCGRAARRSRPPASASQRAAVVGEPARPGRRGRRRSPRAAVEPAVAARPASAARAARSAVARLQLLAVGGQARGRLRRARRGARPAAAVAPAQRAGQRRRSRAARRPQRGQRPARCSAAGAAPGLGAQRGQLPLRPAHLLRRGASRAPPPRRPRRGRPPRRPR